MTPSGKSADAWLGLRTSAWHLSARSPRWPCCRLVQPGPEGLAGQSRGAEQVVREDQA